VVLQELDAETSKAAKPNQDQAPMSMKSIELNDTVIFIHITH
jgi:hypothetical protein